MQHRTLSLGIILLAFTACVDEKTIGEDLDQADDFGEGASSTIGGANSATGGANADVGGDASVGGANSATGGVPSFGGANSATGGVVSFGGANSATGGVVSFGGASSATGGVPSFGGANSATGGVPSFGGANSALGGASPATGGSTGDPITSCTATIAEAQAAWNAPCPDTYAAAQTWADACSDNIRSRASGLCNGTPTVTVSWGTHLKSCYYDPNALTLVGVIAKDDQKSFCGDRFYEMVAGSFPEGTDDSMGDPWARHCHFPTYAVACPDPNG